MTPTVQPEPTAMAVQEPLLDFSVVRRPSARAAAEQVLELAGVRGEKPVPVELIARKAGYKVIGFKAPEGDEHLAQIAGLVKYAEKEIWVSVSDSPQRQRFTIAHELGHIVLGHQADGVRIDYRSVIDGRTDDQREIDANKFAAELLMPALDFIRGFFGRMTDEELAVQFGVSKSAVEVRKKVLKLA